MRRCALLLLAFLLGCTTKYVPTGRTVPISSEMDDVSYHLTVASLPTSESPYLVLNCDARGQETRRFREEAQVRKQLSWALPILSAALGVGGYALLNSQGRAVLGRDAGIVGLGGGLGMLVGNLLQKPKLVEREKETVAAKQFVPARPFKVSLKGTEYATSVTADQSGKLHINMLEFAPFYKDRVPDRDYFSIASPTGEYLRQFSVDLRPIATKLRRASERKYPPALSFSVSFDDSTGDRDLVLDGDESGRIVLVVRNTGRGVAHDLDVRLILSQPVPGLVLTTTHMIDKVGLMESKRVVIPVSATRKMQTGTVELRVEVQEQYFQADAEPRVVKFQTRRFAAPNVVLHEKAVEEGEVVAGKSANITLVVLNQGPGRAERVKCEVKVPVGVTYLDAEPVFNFGSMEPGAWQTAKFTVFVGARFQDTVLPLTIFLRERRREFSTDTTVVFPLNRPVKRPGEVVIKPVVRTDTGVYVPPPTFAVDVDTDIPETGMTNPDAVAVIIANQNYESPSVPAVEYADNDGRVMKEYFKRTLGCRDENIIFYSNARKSDLERAFGSATVHEGMLFDYVKPGKSDVFVYYSGHGAPDLGSRKGYFVPSDCHPDYVKLNGYSLETFYANLAKLPARSVTVVIDACFSGGYDAGMLIGEASPLPVTGVTDAPGSGLDVFTSCDSAQVSSWYSEKHHSLFTYYYLKGLRGEADANKDREVTLGELRDYVTENVPYRARRLRGRTQTPTFSGDESKVIVRLK